MIKGILVFSLFKIQCNDSITLKLKTSQSMFVGADSLFHNGFFTMINWSWGNLYFDTLKKIGGTCVASINQSIIFR